MLTPTKTPRHILLLLGVQGVIILVVDPIDIVKRQLLPLRDIPDRKQRQVMNMLIGMIAHARENPQIRIARMVDEPRGAGQELAVDLERRAPQPLVQRLRVPELVEREQVDVLALRDVGLGAAPVRLGRRDHLAHVLVDELALAHVHRAPDAPPPVRCAEHLQRDAAPALHHPVRAPELRRAARAPLVALVDRVPRRQDLRAEVARPRPVRVVHVRLLAVLRRVGVGGSGVVVFIVIFVIVVVVGGVIIVVVIVHVLQAMAALVLAGLTVEAGAPRPELVRGRFHATAQHRIIGEAEAGVQHCVVLCVDYCHGVLGMRRKGAQLAEMAVLLFLLVTLST